MKATHFFLVRLATLANVLLGAANLGLAFAATSNSNLVIGLGGLVMAPLLSRKHWDNNSTFYALVVLSIGFNCVLRAVVA